jgi:hypothetical protein
MKRFVIVIITTLITVLSTVNVFSLEVERVSRTLHPPPKDLYSNANYIVSLINTDAGRWFKYTKRSIRIEYNMSIEDFNKMTPDWYNRPVRPSDNPEVDCFEFAEYFKILWEEYCTTLSKIYKAHLIHGYSATSEHWWIIFTWDDGQDHYYTAIEPSYHFVNDSIWWLGYSEWFRIFNKNISIR